MGAECFCDTNKRKNKGQVLKDIVEEAEKVEEAKSDNLKKFKDKNDTHYIVGHKISLDKNSTLQKENNTNDLSVNKEINDANSQIQLEIKFPYEKDIPNKIMNVKGNFTIDELEKKFTDEKFVFDRGMSIRNIKKTLSEL